MTRIIAPWAGPPWGPLAGMPGLAGPAGLPDLAGPLLVLTLMLPLAGMSIAFALGGRHAQRIALVTLPVGLGSALAVALAVLTGDAPVQVDLGGWAPPLGVRLRADGLSATLLLTAATIVCAVGLYARADFRVPPGVAEDRANLAFWTLLLGVWGALNAVFLGQDLFNLFVALELLTFSAVPMVCLDGRPETLAAALRYLLFTLLGSVLYLLGAALLYGTYATLDIGLLSARMDAGLAADGALPPPALAAVACMTVGLLAKTAMVPLYLWLPPAHAGAPAAASAVLSALVVKATFFAILRIWADLLPDPLTWLGAQMLAALGTMAILLGGVLALRQGRLKMLVAYSTLSQVGYLFLVFPLLASPQTAALADLGQTPGAWTGGALQLVSHAFAKASMFMAAGLIAGALGHDQISGLRGIGRALPVTVAAFALAGLSLMGLPPSGGFTAKWLLLSAAIATGQWWWTLAILVGGLLTGGYLFRVLAQALSPRGPLPVLQRRAARPRELVALALALCSVALGLLPLSSFGLVQIGRLGATGLGLP